MKKILAIIILLVCQTALAKVVDQSESTKSPPSNSYTLGVITTFLYWQPSEAIDWAITTSIAGNFEGITYHQADSFDWLPGFRVGFVSTTVDDKWNTQIYYTWFQSRTSEQISGTITSAFIGSKAALYNSYQSARMTWKLQLNMFDLDLARNLGENKTFSLQPVIGLKGGWINQTITTSWLNPIVLGARTFLTADENITNDFVGIGPKGGVRGKIVIKSADKYLLSLLSDFAAVYMLGGWDITDEFNGRPTTVTANVGRRTFGSFSLQGLIGVGLDFKLTEEQPLITAKLGYELQDWFNQYQGFDNASGEHNNDLILQGLTLDMRMDF